MVIQTGYSSNCRCRHISSLGSELKVVRASPSRGRLRRAGGRAAVSARASQRGWRAGVNGAARSWTAKGGGLVPAEGGEAGDCALYLRKIHIILIRHIYVLCLQTSPENRRSSKITALVADRIHKMSLY